MIKVLGLIPARGGSKGLPHKNVLPLAGKPLIAHTIEAALGSGVLDRAIVSTDDEEIVRISKGFGAETPFIRPPQLATDQVSIYPAITHCLQWLEEHEGYCPDYLMLLQPTSPLRTSEDIINAVNLAVANDADGVVSLCQAKPHPYWSKRVERSGTMADFITQQDPNYHRQSLPDAYAVNGAIYLAKPKLLLEKDSFYSDRTYAYIMPEERSLDIDTAWDLQLADLIMREEKHRDGY